ncbi:hypothetical protein [Algibacter lectus]|uniref:Uncharacterized protein n=1 Tax=Algibacter lectus TaxID=221126 RepID=A0A4R8M9H7_9FLAO|nr:hypothetical protein [Algibacter lectus]MWW24260.1 hypothetical protein [Algibacter lectus]TDY62279.1 hypothetical protein DFQ06_2105 [Algibacter lectus]
MSIVKIQINHTKNLNKEVLASHLYNLIGEEYNLSEDDVEDYFEVENVYKLPNDSFISIFIIDFPALEHNRDFQPKDTVKSYLDTINSLEEVIGLVKLQDDFLQEIAIQYFNKLFTIEMELRNVLTYILTYDEKAIEKGIFKEFGVQLAESYNNNNVSDNYENGLYYILFNHYASFGEPKRLKAEQISEILQDVSLSDFQEFKNRLQQRYISEERHTEFLFSIKQKLKPLEDMRNSVMHIRNLSDTKIANFDKAVNDDDLEKGVQSLISDFWTAENKELKEHTWLSLAEREIEKYQLRQEEEIWFVDINYGTFILKNDTDEFEDMDEVKNYIYEQLKDSVEINDFEPDCKEQIDIWIDEKIVSKE